MVTAGAGTGLPSARAAEIDPPPGCVLSEPHAIASTYAQTPTVLAPSFGTPTTQVDGSYHVRSQTLTVTNVSAHDLFDTRFFLAGAQVSPVAEPFVPMTWDDSVGHFHTDPDHVWSSPAWEPRDTTSPGATLALAQTPQTPALSRYDAATAGIPLTGTSGAGTSVDFAPTDQIPGYDFTDIAVGEVVTHGLALRVERPTGEANVYAVTYAVALSARTCLPVPTIDPWPGASATGTEAITGTGTTVGDTIELRDDTGNVVGTATVGADLTWSITPATPLEEGTTRLEAVETDEFALTGTSDAVSFDVRAPGIGIDIQDVDGTRAPDADHAADLSGTHGESVVTLTVTNHGGGPLDGVRLATSAARATLDDLACDQDVVADPSTVTLSAGQAVTCTATLSGLPLDETPGSVRATATGLPTGAGEPVTAEAQYWARYALGGDPSPTEPPVPGPVATTPPASAGPLLGGPAGGSPTHRSALAVTGGDALGLALLSALVIAAGLVLVRVRHSRSA